MLWLRKGKGGASDGGHGQREQRDGRRVEQPEEEARIQIVAAAQAGARVDVGRPPAGEPGVGVRAGEEPI